MVRSHPVLRGVLRLLVVGYLVMLVAWPVALVVTHTFDDGFTALSDAFADPNVIHALKMTAIVSVISVLINLVFGVTISILLVRYEFRGKRALSAMIDVPLSVSPVVVGLSLLLVYNPVNGWFGAGLADAGIKIIFSTPGMIMATTFVALPLVIREVVPDRILTLALGTPSALASNSITARLASPPSAMARTRTLTTLRPLASVSMPSMSSRPPRGVTRNAMLMPSVE